LDDAVRRALRARDASPRDPIAAIEAARLLSLAGDRDAAAEAWQEVLRREPGSAVARAELAALGCELVLAGRNVAGFEEYEGGVDAIRFVLVPAKDDLAAFFAAREPVAFGRFLRFCLAVQGRTAPEGTRLGSEVAGYAIGVSWKGARDYARWARGDLPTEKQWQALTAAGAVALVLPSSIEGGEWTRDRDARDTRKAIVRSIVSPERSSHLALGPVGPFGFRYVRETWWKA
jgi:hypothetical protein